MVRDAGPSGVTVKEVRERLDQHHGHASGDLSTLHRVGKINRLAQTRLGNKIYVAPEYVNDRPTEPQGRRKSELSASGH